MASRKAARRPCRSGWWLRMLDFNNVKVPADVPDFLRRAARESLDSADLLKSPGWLAVADRLDGMALLLERELERLEETDG